MIANNGVQMRSQSSPQVYKSFGNFAHNAIELGEMQIQLFKLDCGEAGRRIRKSVVLAIIGLAILLASLPVALFAVAEALIETSDWSRTGALGITATGAIAISFAFGIVGWWKLRQGMITWQRSREELNRNMTWLKAAMLGNASGLESDTRSHAPTSSSVPKRI